MQPPLDAPSMAPFVPVIPGYEVEALLYAGTRALVYRGRDTRTAAAVIIKLLRSERPSLSELVQFRNQYTIARGLGLPGVVSPLALARCHNGFAIIMADTGAMSLSDYRKTRSLSVREVLGIGISLAATLEGLYQKRIIHKDLKPQNILIQPETGALLLTDFSIASLLPREAQVLKSPELLEGTLAYMSPEQTGRMNRSIDYRADFYSLGVTLYELLTGRLPFSASHPLELAHSHIARPPPPPRSVEPSIPEMVERIVLKLMAKTAEERYASAFGLRHDLETCLEALQRHGSIPAFELARRDISDRFHIPEKLFGRQEEVRTLLDAFDRVCQGRVELMLVGGFSGIGKTVVVNEIHKPIVRSKGLFVSGKFDQLGRSVPYSALVQALSHLLQQLLTESRERFEQWKQQLRQALGQDGQVLIDVLPELERIVGPQPAVVELSPAAAQSRFNLLFCRFIRVFATAEHPLVIFLDDLQWADSASLKVLHLLTTELGPAPLLLIGAYRDNEVGPAHPLMLTLEELRKAGAAIQQLTLAPLPEPVVNELVAATLSCPLERAWPLTELVYQRARGNPFFTSQYLKALHQDGCLRYDFAEHMWQCDLAKVRAKLVSSDVVEFIAGQLQRLPSETQEVLELAACIGNRFELATLCRVYGHSDTETATALWPALQEGLVLPTSEVYKFYQGQEGHEGLDSADGAEPAAAQYQFLHDRVQQAAYSLIPSSERQQTHLKIGKRLLRASSAQEREELLFDIVNHLNVCLELLDEPAEREEIARLNLQAGRRALASMAYDMAGEYFEVGLSLLGPTRWESQYALTLALYEEAANAACLGKHFVRQDELVNEVLARARTLLDQMRSYEIRIQGAIARGQLAYIIDTGLLVLRKLGIDLPAEPGDEDIQRGYAEVRRAVGEGPLERLIHLPEMKDARALAAMRILTLLVSPSYQTRPGLLPLIIFRKVTLTTEHGMTPIAAFTYALYGLLLCGAFDEIDAGYQAGQLALEILARFNAREPRAKSIYVVNSYTVHWKRHVRETLKPLVDAYTSGLETGDIEFMAWAADFYCYHAFYLGRPLETVTREMDEYRKVIEQHHRELTIRQFSVFHQAALNLAGEEECPWRLVGRAWNEEVQLPRYMETNDGTGTCIAYLHKLMLAYLFEQHRLAVESADAAEKYLAAVTAQLVVPYYYFFDSLARLALLPELGAEEREAALRRVEANQQRLGRWAKSGPMNFLHKYHLVEAERCRVRGARAEALEHYDRAIALARENEYPNDEALAHELAARFFLEWGLAQRARPHLHEAYDAYTRWGARAKLRHLITRYSEQGWRSPPPGPAAHPPQERDPSRAQLTATLFSASVGQQLLDLQSVLEASQVLFSEMNLDRLLERVMVILSENAGAQRCVILHQARQLTLVMEHLAVSGETRRYAEATPAGAQDVPASIIHLAIQTQQPVLSEDLSRDSTSSDPYIQQRSPRSALALPIFHQGQLLLVVYLENNLTPGAFTSRHLQTLTLLASQVALSLENAALYGDLERRVAERTRALEEAHQQLVTVAHRAGMAEIASGVLHNIGNTLSSLVVTSDMVMTELQRLPVDPLKKSAQLLADQQEHLAEFLRDDPRGKLLPTYLDKLGESLRSSSARMLVDLQAMKDNLDQIGATIQVQQAYAHGPRLVEQVELSSLIEDALRMHRASITRHHVEIELDIAPLPAIPLERNKTLHILLNLISNAKRAVLEAERPDKRISLKVHPSSPGHLAIVVRDNGVGIPAENLRRVFEFGFSTRGSLGYGLHWAAIAAEEMGGTLSGASDGPGLGATFTLELPLSGSSQESRADR